jgi:N6-adenosine-specific RNA methylase IME4
MSRAELVRYSQACVAIAECKAVDEAKEILDRHEAMRVYAHQAKNRSLEIDCAEIRIRAEHRLGQLLALAKEAGQIREGRVPNCDSGEQFPRLTLEEVGIDRRLSSHAQKLARLDLEAFEKRLAAWREAAVAGGDRIQLDVLKIGQEQESRDARRDLARELGDTSALLTGKRKFSCVYADPAWSRKAGISDRSYENHYPTMTWDEIVALPIADLMLEDAWLFLWVPRAHLLAAHPIKIDVALEGTGEVVSVPMIMPLPWAIAQAWGFNSYSTCFVWTKTDDEFPDDSGLGLVAWDQDEILCLFKRGEGLPKPSGEEKFGSNHRERSKPLGHSRKPDFYRQMIATMTGGLPVLELFARVDAEHPLPEGWEAWGNQSQSSDGGVESRHAESPLTDQAKYTDGSTESRLQLVAGAAPGPSDSLPELPQEAPGTAREAPSTLCEREPEPSDSDVGTQSAPPPNFDDESEMRVALAALACGQGIGSAMARHLIGLGFVHATTTNILVTEEGLAWLDQTLPALAEEETSA